MFDYFDRVYCIHLPNPKRRERMEKVFADVGIRDVQWVAAKPPGYPFEMSNMRRNPKGEFGANLSHLKAIVHAMLDGAERPLFFEDDVEFIEPQRMAEAVKELPKDWDVLYLGGHPRGEAPKVRPFSNNLWSVELFSFAESYAIQRKALWPFFDFWCDRISQPDAMFDFALGEFAGANKGFVVYPLMTSQINGKSQISGKDDDKHDLVARGWMKHRACALSGAY